MLFTRWIEDNQYFREKVVSAEVLSAEGNCLILKANAVLGAYDKATSADTEMFSRMKNIGIGDCIEGRICIEFLEKDSLRIRFSKGTEIVTNETLMVEKELAPAEKCQFCTEENQVVVDAGDLHTVVTLKPYFVQITNQKTGKTVEVGGNEKNYFNTRDSLNTGVCYMPDDSLPVATENFALSPHEAIYGFGEKFLKLNKVGQTLELYAADGIGTGTPRTYKNIPFYVSTNGYGVYFNHSAAMTFWVGSKYAGDIQVAIEDDFLDYYIFTGDIKTVLDSYTSLTGKSPMPPKWSYGYWQSKITYVSAEETLDIVEHMRKEEIPCDVIHVDTCWFKEDWFCDWEFDKERFPDVEGYVRKLSEQGVKLSLWQLPYVRQGSKAFEEFQAVDGFVKTKDGEMYDLRTLGLIMYEKPEPIGIIDFTNPKAVEVYKELLRRLFRMGVRIIKTDFGEAIPEDGVYFDGTPGHRMHNLYPLLYNQAAYEVNEEMHGEGIVWGRSAYAGNQRYPLYWGGDNSPNFHNMIPQLAGGLSFGLSGFPFWSQDVGGFLGDTYDELLIRWMQYSILMSHIRIHGSGMRELYKFGDECVRICKDYLQLRYRLLPYLWGSSQKCCENGLPITRALVIDYQDDPNVWNIEDQYLSGESLMVAPIYTPDNKRMVYFPKGVWVDWHTGEKIEGGVWKEIHADIETLPLYVKEGAIIPLGPTMNYVGEEEIDEIELLIYPFEKEGVSNFTVLTEDKMIDVKYRAQDGEHTVYIGETDVKVNVVIQGDMQTKVVYTQLD